MMLLSIVFEVMLTEGNLNPFLFNDCKKTRYSFSLEFLLQQCLLVQGLCQGLASYMDVKNNHNTLLALPFLFTSISFKVTLS